MGLSNDMISEFVKVVNADKKTTSTEATVNGTVVKYDGRTFVRVDGSDVLTPVNSTISTNDGDRVQVLIKDHSATVTGNVSDPSASSTTVEEQGSKISEFEIVMAYKVTTEDLEAVNAAIENLKATAAKLQDATIVNAEIENLKAKFADLEYVNATDIEAITANIESIQAKFGEYEDLTTEDLEAVNAEITNLKGYAAEFTYVSADVLVAMKANIKDLDAEKLSAKEAELTYANIDFSNIGEAAVKKLFTESGIIKNLVMSDGAVTGELVGVTIRGDLIEGNTIIADKLVIKGKDGLYYKLNTSAGATTSETITEEELQNGLDGSIIIAKSVTAEKVNVDDLVAFGATIGGFHIVGSTEDKAGAIYSGVKESVDNTTRGTYLDDDGQVAFGDASNFIKFYKDEETGKYYLRISADAIVFGGSGRDVESDLINISGDVTNNQTVTSETSAKIEDLKRILQQVITDEHGQSLMITVKESYTLTDELIASTSDGFEAKRLDGVTTTTGETVYLGIYSDGTEVYFSFVNEAPYKVTYNPETYTFNISDLEDAIAAINANVTNLSNKTDSIDGTITQMLKTVTDMALIGGYIVIDENMEVENSDGTKEVVPAIILGASDSDFKVIITNKQIAFCEGDNIPAYISGQTFIAQNVEVKQELRQGGFSWVVHDGNYGLVWRGRDCVITQNLASEISSSNTETVVTMAESFSTSLSITDGYVIGSVVVIMDGKDVSNKVVSNNLLSCEINIPRVKGDVVIKATSTENLWDISSRTFADANVDDTTYAKITLSTASYPNIRTEIPMDSDDYIKSINTSNNNLSIELKSEATETWSIGYSRIELLFEAEQGATYQLSFVSSDVMKSGPVVTCALLCDSEIEVFNTIYVEGENEQTYTQNITQYYSDGYISLIFDPGSTTGMYCTNVVLYKINNEVEG